ncbi:MAG: type II secretion system F family protein [Planctomycetaceae bacterium]|nr:type II secretion system F family protein [Planctomycetaceae bacterium]
MNQSEIALIAFGSLTLMIVAMGLLLRDLLVPKRVFGPSGGGKLRRRATVYDTAPPRGVFQKIDQAFDRLVLETDTGITPVGAFLLILVSGLTLGGGVWLYSDNPLSGLMSGMLGMTLPIMVMSVQRSRRMREIQDQMPHVLDMLARASRAGQTSEQAIDMAGRELEGRLSREFRNCSHQLSLGRSFGAVMNTLSARVRTVEMRILTTTLTVQRQTGGNLSETLERMAGVVRDRLNGQRQMRASTGAGRASTLVIATISPLAYLFMFVFQREYLEGLMNDPLGRLLLMVAFVLEIVGILWVAMLLRQER